VKSDPTKANGAIRPWMSPRKKPGGSYAVGTGCVAQEDSSTTKAIQITNFLTMTLPRQVSLGGNSSHPGRLAGAIQFDEAQFALNVWRDATTSWIRGTK
jgi:hypothetical protein